MIHQKVKKKLFIEKKLFLFHFNTLLSYRAFRTFQTESNKLFYTFFSRILFFISVQTRAEIVNVYVGKVSDSIVYNVFSFRAICVLWSNMKCREWMSVDINETNAHSFCLEARFNAANMHEYRKINEYNIKCVYLKTKSRECNFSRWTTGDRGDAEQWTHQTHTHKHTYDQSERKMIEAWGIVLCVINEKLWWNNEMPGILICGELSRSEPRRASQLDLWSLCVGRVCSFLKANFGISCICIATVAEHPND